MDRHQVDEAYHEELKVVDELGIPYTFFNFDEFIEDKKSTKAFEHIEKGGYEQVIYRGWMVGVEDYRYLYNRLIDKGLWLINCESQYLNCHWFPSTYNLSIVRRNTPKIVFVPKRDFKLEDTRYYVRQLIDNYDYNKKFPIIIKDYVKSEKHFWNEACFCPNARDEDHVEKVVKRFMELRDIEGGIVFKEFVELDCVQFDPILKTQTAKEYRLFFLNGKMIDCIKYWEGNEYDEMPPLEKFEEIGKKINSNFFSMDVAKKKDGTWIIIEVGDGQVTGLPKSCDIKKFYTRLREEMERQ